MTHFREMTPADLSLVLDWAAAEGWNPGLEDAEAFHAADPGGFFVAEEQGVPVAAISVVNHSDSFAFLGLYLCQPDWRGRGIGYGLWQHAIGHAGTRTVGLDGVPDQQANYARSGFVHAGATTRYAGQVAAKASARVRSATDADIPDLIALEAGASGWFKPAYLSAWFGQSAQRTTYVLGRADGAILSMVTVRACREGAKIGPLVAADAEDALALLHHAATAFGEALIIDVPGSSQGLAGICQSLGLAPGFHTARMYRGAGQAARSWFYAVASLELG
jgi:GNAT superfamily N-acetyltransferase